MYMYSLLFSEGLKLSSLGRINTEPGMQLFKYKNREAL